MTKTIIITGTHHTPAIELIKQLHRDTVKWDIHYIGHIYPTETHLLNTVIPKLKVNFHNLESGKFDRRWLPNTIKGIPKTIKAVFASFRLIKTINPDIIISFGGYISVPVIIAGWFYRHPSITHEQTLTPSLSTRINAIFVNKIALSFKDTLRSDSLPLSKTVVTGNLLRSDIFRSRNLNFPALARRLDKYPLIYVTGGNQGSASINANLKKVAPKLTSRFTILHQTGKLQYPDLLNYNRQKKITGYHPVEYVGLDDIGWVLKNAVLIISRAGANICQEIAALKRSSILIPLPYSQQNEQEINAQWVHHQLPCQTVIINDNQLTSGRLLSAVSQLTGVMPRSVAVKPVKNLALLKLIHELT